MGNLTKDPELRYTPNGRAVVNFTIAVNRNYTTQDGERKEEVSFIPVKVWGKQAENCNQYLGKGRSVFVDGRLHQRRWESEDGQKRSAIEVVGLSVQFLDTALRAKEEEIGEEEVPPIEDEEEVPF
jgi:single-strand DNA-binding protein